MFHIREPYRPAHVSSPVFSGNKSVDSVLATPPTYADIQRIRRDFNISFGPGVSPSEQEMLVIYNAFRGAKHIRFDTPLPLMGTKSVYDWLVSRGNAIRFEKDLEYSTAGDPIHLRIETLRNGISQWVSTESGSGVQDLIALIVHEYAHDFKGHDCNEGASDSSIAYGGPWAYEYYFYLWLAQHSGDYLSDREKQRAQSNANSILKSRICSVKDPGATVGTMGAGCRSDRSARWPRRRIVASGCSGWCRDVDRYSVRRVIQ